MAAASDIHDSNIVIGAGEIFLDKRDADGNLTGEQYVGDSNGLTIEIQEERVQVASADGAIAKQLVNNVVSRTYTLTANLRDMSIQNWSTLLYGVSESEIDASNAVADEAFAAMPDRWYQLGVSASKPMGYLAVSGTSVAITGGANKAAARASSTAFTKDDFVVDAENGRVYFKADGKVTTASPWVNIDYTPIAGTHARARTTSPPKDVFAALRYIEDASAGAGANIYIPRCNLGANGSVTIKTGDRQSPQGFDLTFGVIERPGDDGSAIIVDRKAG